MNLVKGKMNISSQQEKLELLIHVPKTWEIRKVYENFGVNPYTVKQARELLSLNRILTKPSPKRGKTIADQVVDAMKQFFCNDNYSRLMQEKNTLLVSRKIFMNKSACYYIIFQNFILILSNIFLK